ncbi:MAG: glycerol-3-phosphate 1-O-acyltransferase PlsY [Verrucomicrobiota bacterium]
MWFLAFFIVVMSYLFGSVPIGFIVGKLAGVDIRKSGSGNIGATNVLRVLGKKYGYAVFFLDALKGFAAVRISLALVSTMPAARTYADSFALLGAVACVIGHAFPIWLKFKGGKGVATSAGVLIGLMPLAAAILFPLWFIVFEICRYVSVASMFAAISLPITVALFLKFKVMDSVVLLYFSIALAVVVVWQHRSNLSRLLNGTEQRFKRK